MRQFFYFCIVGTIGFLADAGALYLLTRGLGLDLYSARLVSYLIAATVTWIFNRNFTFQVLTRPTWREWFAYLIANGLGAIANYSVYVLGITQFEQLRLYPVGAVAIGSVVGLAFNYIANRYVIFRR